MITLTIPPAPPAIVFTVPAPQPAEPVICFERLADAIRAVENSGERERGADDEWGFFQIRPQVWNRYSQVIQWNAPEAEQRRVALTHLRVLAEKLELAGIEPTPYALGLAWNAGEGRAVRGYVPKSARKYAGYVRNIYEESSKLVNLASMVDVSCAGQLMPTR